MDRKIVLGTAAMPIEIEDSDSEPEPAQSNSRNTWTNYNSSVRHSDKTVKSKQADKLSDRDCSLNDHDAGVHSKMWKSKLQELLAETTTPKKEPKQVIHTNSTSTNKPNNPFHNSTSKDTKSNHKDTVDPLDEYRTQPKSIRLAIQSINRSKTPTNYDETSTTTATDLSDSDYTYLPENGKNLSKGRRISRNSKKRGKGRYECSREMCGWTFDRKDQFEYHLANHDRLKPFKCHCGRSFHAHNLLKKHLVTHSSRFNACAFCNKTFTKESTYFSHLNTHPEFVNG